MVLRISTAVGLLLFFLQGFSQDSLLVRLPSKYLDNVSAKANHLDRKLDQKSDKVLLSMMRQEQKMKRKLSKIDSLKAEQLFGNVEERYGQLKQRLATKLSGKKYIPSLDSLSTSLKFLQQNPQSVSQIKNGEEKVKEAMGKVSGLEDKFQQADEIKKFLKERKQQLKEQLTKLGFVKNLKKINKQIYYYSEEVKEYSEILKDPKKIERKALQLLAKSTLFRDFMQKNSMLATLFRFPTDPNDPLSQANLAGLQTRVQVSNLIQQQVGTNSPAALSQFRQNMQTSQSQINQLKSGITESGGSSEDIMPEGFTPNNQKTKSFFRRLEFGTNLQSQKASYFFPTTSDIGLSVGYKINDKSIIGLGASYKLGLGNGWNHIKFSNEGAGLRSFLDWKLKGSFWVTGGYEMNYKTSFNDFYQLHNLSEWQQSGLMGMSKVISIRSKFFKKTKLQLLWDFLSYHQIPKTQPIIFRVGYNLN
jgi:hypothetical protein